MQREESNFACGRCPIDQNQWKRLATILMIELIGENHIAGRVLWQFWKRPFEALQRYSRSRQCTFCQILERYRIELLNFFHDEFLLVDLDNHGGTA